MSASSGEPFRVPIRPVAEGVDRPRWSVMIPTYHCADYLRESLGSVLAQDPGPHLMQIEVVDDHSTNDDPEGVVREVGGGRVSFFRQPENVGHSRNFAACLERARGELVHLLHGDDFVLHGFYRIMEQPFARHPEIGAAFSRHIYVDEESRWLEISRLLERESGVLAGWLERIAEQQLLQPPSMVVRRSVYEHLGGFDDRIVSYGEDWEMWVRIAASYRVWHQVDPLAAYRVRTSSLSDGAIRTGQNLRDMTTAIEATKSVLPSGRAKELSRTARRNFALGAIRISRRMLRRGGDVRTAALQLRGALRLSSAPAVLLRAAILAAHCALVLVTRPLGAPRD